MRRKSARKYISFQTRLTQYLTHRSTFNNTCHSLATRVMLRMNMEAQTDFPRLCQFCTSCTRILASPPSGVLPVNIKASNQGLQWSLITGNGRKMQEDCRSSINVATADSHPCSGKTLVAESDLSCTLIRSRLFMALAAAHMIIQM